MKKQNTKQWNKRSVWSLFSLMAGLLLPASAFAMGGREEKIADFMVWVVIIVVPLAALYLFWKVHVLPEVYAEKHNHPQKRAIQVLCLLSLISGGLLWPLAWLWAFTKPVAYKLAYGTDKHDDYFLKPNGEHGDKPMDLAIVHDEMLLLQEKMDGLRKKRTQILGKHESSIAMPTKSEERNNA